MTAPTTGRGPAAIAWLRRQPRRNLLVIALLPILIGLWVPLISGGNKSAPTAPAATPPATASGSAPPSAPLAEMAPPASLAGIAAVTELGARIEELRQPFEPRWQPARDEVATSHATPAEPTATVDHGATALVPSSILVSPGRPALAIVQGRACAVGDSVLGHTVVAITEQLVVYRDGSRLVNVPIPPAPLGGRR